MKFSLFYSSILTLGLLHLSSANRIVGGEEAALGRYPYFALLLDASGNNYCGGVLVYSYIVYTAAHCPPPDYVKIGCHTTNDNCEKIEVQSSYVHEKYDKYELSYGFRIIILKYVSFSPVILVADHSWNELPPETTVTTIGFGTTSFEGIVSDTLLQVEVVTKSNEFCEDAYGRGYIDDSMLCAYSTGKDACQGDSGGPLIVKCDDGEDVLVGIVSWGFGCANSWPGVYSRVSKAYEFFITSSTWARPVPAPDLYDYCGGEYRP